MEDQTIELDNKIEEFGASIYKIKEQVKTRERKVLRNTAWKTFLIDQGFDTCKFCGYNKCLAAIDCHHLIPEHKSFNICSYTSTHHTTKEHKEIVKKELDKCIPLCSNCHRELHSKELSGRL